MKIYIYSGCVIALGLLCSASNSIVRNDLTQRLSVRGITGEVSGQDYLVNRAHMGSMWLMIFGVACYDIEMMQCLAAWCDLDRFGMIRVGARDGWTLRSWPAGVVLVLFMIANLSTCVFAHILG